MNHFLRYLFFLLVVRPVLLVIVGLNIRRRELLPACGPALVVANHNSHLDALALMAMFPIGQLRKVRPVAAADFFLEGRFLPWFATRIIGIIPLERRPQGKVDHLAPLCEALDAGEIVILFPEGSRGEPERLDEFKTGLAHIAKRKPDAPVTPIFMHGFGKVLPRGEALLVPLFCDVFVGESFTWTGDRGSFMRLLTDRMAALASEGQFPTWIEPNGGADLVDRPTPAT